MKRPITTISPKLSTDITGRKNNYQRTGIFVEINHKGDAGSNLHGYPLHRKDNEAMSRGMLEALKRQGVFRLTGAGMRRKGVPLLCVK